MDDEVVSLVDALHPPQPGGRFDRQPGLLGHLSHDGDRQGLPPLHPPAGHAPQPEPGAPAPLDQEQSPLVDDDAAHTDLGVGAAQGLSSRYVVSSRAVMPDRS